MGGSHGIDETLKVLRAVKDDVIQLLHINWELVIEELKDMDAKEVKELVIEFGSALIQIIAALKLGMGPIRKILKLI